MARPLASCPYCPARFTPTHHRQFYCTPAHKKAMDRLQQVRGQRIAVLVQAWRTGRHRRPGTADRATANDALSQLATLADQWNAEDKAAGRPGAIKLLQRRSAMMEGIR